VCCAWFHFLVAVDLALCWCWRNFCSGLGSVVIFVLDFLLSSDSWPEFLCRFLFCRRQLLLSVSAKGPIFPFKSRFLRPIGSYHWSFCLAQTCLTVNSQRPDFVFAAQISNVKRQDFALSVFGLTRSDLRFSLLFSVSSSVRVPLIQQFTRTVFLPCLIWCRLLIRSCLAPRILASRGRSTDFVPALDLVHPEWTFGSTSKVWFFPLAAVILLLFESRASSCHSRAEHRDRVLVKRQLRRLEASFRRQECVERSRVLLCHQGLLLSSLVFIFVWGAGSPVSGFLTPLPATAIPSSVPFRQLPSNAYSQFLRSGFGSVASAV
jgi:hypothetical protein